MKQPILSVVSFIWLLSGQAFAQQEPKGALFYQEPGASSVEMMEYRSFVGTNALYATVVRMDGHQKQIKTAEVIGAFDYPPATFDRSLPDTANFNLKKLQAAIVQFPQLRGQLEPLRAKWERALSVYSQTNPSPVLAHESPSLPMLKIQNEQYLHVRLTGVTNESASISHETGIARIPVRLLNVSQIAGLNTTSKTIQLGTMVPPEPRPAEGAPSGGLTSKIRNAGMSILGLIERRTGVHSEAIGTWLLFVILPVLIVFLIALNVFQGRRLKGTRARDR